MLVLGVGSRQNYNGHDSNPKPRDHNGDTEILSYRNISFKKDNIVIYDMHDSLEKVMVKNLSASWLSDNIKMRYSKHSRR